VNDPVAMLKRDHREVEELLTKLADSKPGPRRRATVDKVLEALTLHMQIEERLVYPLVSRVVGSEEAEEAEIEHRLAREGMAHLREMVDEPGFGAVVEMLKAGIKHHVKEEEKEIFPQLKRKLDREQLGELGEKALAMMPASKRRQAVSPRGGSPRSARAKSARKSTRKSTRTSTRKTTRKASSRSRARSS
jgi:hemerythrin superfamily protein